MKIYKISGRAGSCGWIVGPDGKRIPKQEVFASGFLEGDQGYLGRPERHHPGPRDGSILVADDWAGADLTASAYSKSRFERS